MVTDEEWEKLEGIFSRESTYDYILYRSKKKGPRSSSIQVMGICHRNDKVIEVFAHESYWGVLFTILHEVAHSRILYGQHTMKWEEEFVRLLKKYNFPANEVPDGPKGPHLKEYIRAS